MWCSWKARGNRMVTVMMFHLFLLFLLSLLQDVRASTDYVPSFYTEGGFDNDDIYNAKFRFVPCSICFRNEVVTQPDLVLPVNTAGVLNEASTCAATDAVAASGTYSPAVCVLLRSRVRSACGCQIPPPPTIPVSTTVNLTLEGSDLGPLDPTNEALFETICSILLAEQAGDVENLTCEVLPVPTTRFLMRSLQHRSLQETITVQVVITGRTDSENPISEEELQEAATETLNGDGFLQMLQEQSPDYFGEVDSVAVETVATSTPEPTTAPVDTVVPAVPAVQEARMVGPFSLGGFAMLMVAVALVLVILIGLTYPAGTRASNSGSESEEISRRKQPRREVPVDYGDDKEEVRRPSSSLPLSSSQYSSENSTSRLLNTTVIPNRQPHDKDNINLSPPSPPKRDSASSSEASGSDAMESVIAQVMKDFSESSSPVKDISLSPRERVVTPTRGISLGSGMVPVPPSPDDDPMPYLSPASPEQAPVRNEQPAVLSPESPLEISGPFENNHSLTSMEGYSIPGDSIEGLSGQDGSIEGFSVQAAESQPDNTDTNNTSSNDGDNDVRDDSTFQSSIADIRTRTVTAPPGKLGIVIDTTIHGPVVHRVSPKSPLHGHMLAGDLIVSVDDVVTRDMSASAITALMVRTSGVRRTMKVMRSDDLDQDMV